METIPQSSAGQALTDRELRVMLMDAFNKCAPGDPWRSDMTTALSNISSEYVGTEADVKTLIARSASFAQTHARLCELQEHCSKINTHEARMLHIKVGTHKLSATCKEWAQCWREAGNLLAEGHRLQEPTAAKTPTSIVREQQPEPMQEDGEVQPPYVDLTSEPPKRGLSQPNEDDSDEENQLVKMALMAKPPRVTKESWFNVTEYERQLLVLGAKTEQSNHPVPALIHDQPFSPVPFVLPVEHKAGTHSVVRSKYSDKLLPPPEKFRGEPNGLSIALFLHQLQAYFQVQLGQTIPNEEEWGILLPTHLAGDALDLVFAETERLGRSLKWSEACALLKESFADMAHNMVQLTEQIDALKYEAFEGKGGIAAFCNKFQSIATKMGKRRSDDDHVKHLYGLVPGRMQALINAKVDYTQPVRLAEVLRILRTSRFGLESASSVTKEKKDRDAGQAHRWGEKKAWNSKGWGDKKSGWKGNKTWHRSDQADGGHTMYNRMQLCMI